MTVTASGPGATGAVAPGSLKPVTLAALPGGAETTDSVLPPTVSPGRVLSTMGEAASVRAAVQATAGVHTQLHLHLTVKPLLHQCGHAMGSNFLQPPQPSLQLAVQSGAVQRAMHCTSEPAAHSRCTTSSTSVDVNGLPALLRM